jgi:hypothetical protein
MWRCGFETAIEAVEAESWSKVGERLARLGLWEFEDYEP